MKITKQEYIPVGCVPSAAVAVSPGEGGSASVHAGISTPPGADPPRPGTPRTSPPPRDQAPHLWTDTHL